jgi:hypothetical protein
MKIGGSGLFLPPTFVPVYPVCNTHYRAIRYALPGRGTSTRWTAPASPDAPVATPHQIKCFIGFIDDLKTSETITLPKLIIAEKKEVGW